MRTWRALLALLAWRCVTAKHNERPTQTGAWAIPTGFRAYHMDSPLATAIATLLGRGQRNLTMLDMGAGKGLYVRFLSTVLGMTHVEGIEGVRNIEKLTNGRIKQADFTIPFERCRAFDVVMCLEVAEHIPTKSEETFLRNVNCSATRGLIMSWAPPGQGGSGHVNLRSRKEVLSLVGSYGFVLDGAATRFLGGQARLLWFKNNVLALQRSGERSPFEASGTSLRPAASSKQAPKGNPTGDVLNKLRAAYADIEARLDELGLVKSAPPHGVYGSGGDVLLERGLSGFHGALSTMAAIP